MGALPLENDRHEPLPSDPSGKQLCLIFTYLWQAIVGTNAADPNWQTLKTYPLRPRVLWRLWQDSAQLVGVRFDTQTRYALIDIDRASSYHPAQDPEALRTIRAALETIGIYRIIVIRSSWSGGLHLYIPLPEAVPTFGLASALQQCLTAQEMTIAAGELEVFPNCKSYAVPGSFTEYNAHRLPLQPASGSCLLDAEYNPLSQDLGQFLAQWDTAAAGQDIHELRGAIATARSNRRGKRHRKTTVVEEWLQDLRTEMEEGWTGHGQTNHLLKTIACYGVVFEGLKGDALTDFVHQTAIHSSGFWQWCAHQSDIGHRATVWARAAEGYYWALGDDRQREGTVHSVEGELSVSKNLLRAQEAQARIRSIVTSLSDQGVLPEGSTARAKAIASQGAVSLKTLYRYPHLWHPDHLNPPQTLEPVRSGKTLELKPDLTIEKVNSDAPGRSPQSSNSKEFYTLEKLMKGSPFESGSVSTHDHLTARRLDSTDCGKNCETAASSLPPSPGIPLSADGNLDDGSRDMPVSQSPNNGNGGTDILNRFQVESDCVQALVRGDRPWVLKRLFTLWREGHQELVRALCRQHPAWKVSVTEAGPVEVSCDAP